MIVVYVILAAIAALFAVLLANTAIKTAKMRKLTRKTPECSEAELEKYGKAMQEMLQCKTVSVKDSYDDTEFAKLRNVVRSHFPLLHQKAEQHIFLVAYGVTGQII